MVLALPKMCPSVRVRVRSTQVNQIEIATFFFRYTIGCLRKYYNPHFYGAHEQHTQYFLLVRKS